MKLAQVETKKAIRAYISKGKEKDLLKLTFYDNVGQLFSKTLETSKENEKNSIDVEGYNLTTGTNCDLIFEKNSSIYSCDIYRLKEEGKPVGEVVFEHNVSELKEVLEKIYKEAEEKIYGSL